jgi:CysZ protein
MALAVLGGLYALDAIASYMAQNPLLASAGKILVVLVWLLLFPFLFTMLVGIFTPVFFDRLSLAVEETVNAGEPVPNQPPPLPRLIGDTLSRLLLNLSLTVLALLLSFGLHLGPLPWFFVAGIIGVLDFTAPAFLRRGILLGGQWKLLFSAGGSVWGFMLIASLISLLPLIGVFFLPGLVAGGTLLTQKVVKPTQAN